MSRYVRPELPPVDALRDATKQLKEANDARAKKLAAGAGVALVAARGALDEMAENCRIEILTLCDLGDSQDAEGRLSPAERLAFYQGLCKATREFCALLSARTAARRNDAMQAMRDAIDSLNRYQGVGR